jgi:hypothetical protein
LNINSLKDIMEVQSYYKPHIKAGQSGFFRHNRTE